MRTNTQNQDWNRIKERLKQNKRTHVCQWSQVTGEIKDKRLRDNEIGITCECIVFNKSCGKTQAFLLRD